MHEIRVPILSNDQCGIWIQDKGKKPKVPRNMMCAGYKNGGKDACKVCTNCRKIYFLHMFYLAIVSKMLDLPKSKYFFKLVSELQGDSGGPLVVQRRDGSFFLAG